jgi:hypothetical protein
MTHPLFATHTMQILQYHDLVILSCLCRAYESEEMSKALIRLFNSEGFSLRFLVQLIYRDLRETSMLL